ncbi:DUF1778 domain-containing protein [Spongiibacter nanhainus]|uniref:DUF1778 domain-containing protein n=1 Tax=Spongiibacter nanhainus TaxID=2794344 RepID=A0A7T4QZ62_9GAMM|nr:DUF1778 domain-containing protein [Spongiibacter nanhainus]QQD17456.1 DUF1778 domain-containing protein [Spongiibacter nanhainus]
MTTEYRLVVSLPSDVHQLVLAAAELSGTTIDQFVLDAVVSKAHAVTRHSTKIELTMESANEILSALDSEPSPPAALKDAARRFKAAGLSATLDLDSEDDK